MKKTDTNTKIVVALAYFHRYGWIAAIMGCSLMWTNYFLLILGIGCLFFSIWSLIGYISKWKHIYCSYQDANHQRMTPNNIQWYKMKKSDVYLVSILFLIFGTV